VANDWFAKGRQAFATAQVNWSTGGDSMEVILVDTTGITISLATMQFVADITALDSGALIARGPLANLDATDGVLDADDVTLPTVTGDQAEALAIDKATGNDATSPLLMFIDEATGLPITPNGGDVTVQWNPAGIGTL
jgi:hypothetical protein